MGMYGERVGAIHFVC